MNSIIRKILDGHMKKRYGKTIILVLVVGIIVLCSIRIYQVNKVYPAPVFHTAKAGDTLEYEGVTYQVNGWKVLDLEELKKTESGLFLGNQERIEGLENLEGYSWCYVCVDLTVKNNMEKDVSISEDLRYFDCREYCNGGFFTDENGENLVLAAGESADVKFFTNINNEKDFQHTYDGKKAKLVLSQYPEQYELKLE